MEALLALGVDGPESATNELSTEAVAGVVRWAQDSNRKGRAPSSGAIVMKLRNGGLIGYGVAVGPAKEWWRTWQGRERWIESNIPDLDPIHAETAIISLTQLKREPTEKAVRLYAQLAERQDQEHHARCKEALAATRPALSGRAEAEGGTAFSVTSPRRSVPHKEDSAAPAARPESADSVGEAGDSGCAAGSLPLPEQKEAA